MAPNRRGRNRARRNPLEKRVCQLEAEVTRLKQELATPKTILEV
ncbi:MAG: hypothetical protein OXT72_05575 [Gammaproteobacteria bacterium]|nr:hypothetical protein [Gammaproteobacteria bacterium]